MPECGSALTLLSRVFCFFFTVFPSSNNCSMFSRVLGIALPARRVLCVFPHSQSLHQKRSVWFFNNWNPQEKFCMFFRVLSVALRHKKCSVCVSVGISPRKKCSICFPVFLGGIALHHKKCSVYFPLESLAHKKCSICFPESPSPLEISIRFPVF